MENIIKLDDFLTADHLDGPITHAVIKNVDFIEPSDLPFDSNKGKYELTLDIEGEEYKWLANKTSLRSLRESFGKMLDDWIGKAVKLWSVEQPVQGKMKKVVYADAD